MERTEYFNHTRPAQTQLNNTEDSKIRGILRRARSNAQFGVRTGFIVTVNSADATLIDVGPGEGYTGGFFRGENLKGDTYSGEIISTLTEAATGQPGYIKTVDGLGLADYSANTKNYVSLVFVEAEGAPLAERYYPFTSHNTIISESYTSEVLIEADWVALTADEKEGCVLVAIVTAQGAGNPLAAANIQQLVQPRTHSVAGTQPSNITGVVITGVSDETLIGNGTLRFETATKKLYWTAPGDAEGIGVVIGSSGVSTLYSDDVSYWIFVDVIFAGLPASNFTDTISIESLYGRTIPMACATDQEHRDMLGSGVLSPTNPHATSIDDLTGGTFEHAELYHMNGISRDAQTDQLECSINHGNNSIEIINNGSARNSFLIDGINYNLITGYDAGIVGRLTFSPLVPALDSGDYLIYIDSAGEPQYVKIAEYTPADAADVTVLWDINIQIYDMHNQASGQGRIDWDQPTNELWYTAPGDAAGTHVNLLAGFGFGVAQVYGFYKLYSSNGIDWVIVFVDGSLGATNNSVFDIDKNETEHPDDSMLKIGVVTWNQTGEIHDNLRDIRRFNTADNRDEVEEEHDENGLHTKVMQSPLRVAIESDVAFNAEVKGHTAIFGNAYSDVGVYGRAIENTGVKGVAATDTGGYFSAVDSYGIYGTASTYAVAGYADERYGVFGSAPLTGVFGVAGNAVGPGVEGQASNIGVSGEASTNRGVRGSAGSSYGVYGTANVEYGVWGGAGADYGVFGIAVHDYGVYGSAINNTGVYGSAVHKGVVGEVPGNYGVSGKAGDYGVYGDATADYGVYGIAISNYGVYAQASQKAVFAHATGVGNVTGIVGTVTGTDATGVFGGADASGGIGVYGTGGDPSGVGVLGLAVSATGGLFYGSVVGILASGIDAAANFDGIGGTALFLENGIFRYDIATVADGVNLAGQDVPVSCAMVPININGTMFRFAIFTS